MRGLSVFCRLEIQQQQCIQEDDYIHRVSACEVDVANESFCRLLMNVTVRGAGGCDLYGWNGAFEAFLAQFGTALPFLFTLPPLTNFGRNDPHAGAVQQLVAVHIAARCTD
jgi:hypothetical protein